MKTSGRFGVPGILMLVVVLSAVILPAARSAWAYKLTGTRELWRGTVELMPLLIVKDADGQQRIFTPSAGSGTIISPDGLILTNHHVTDVSAEIDQLGAQGLHVLRGKILVMLTKALEEPPVPSYLADIEVDRPDFDLTLLRITTSMSGGPVDPSDLDLPFIEVGDSDEVQLEETIRIYGYPCIGGSNLTFTKGTVSGFDAQQGIPGRAWIKTDASIAGGNSGGTAVNDGGRLIGVPTIAAVPSADKATDCRVIQDTNSDGVLDERDTCIPIGGFINSLRPVNLAAAMITSARSGAGQPPDDRTADSGGEGVILAGVISDAQTGKPVSGATFVALVPGVSWRNFAPNRDQIFTTAVADINGRFLVSRPFERGKSYSMGWGAPGYADFMQDGVDISRDAVFFAEVKVELDRQ